jgi:hypothetical protein
MPPVLEGADAIDAAKVTPGKINYAERMYGHKSCSHSNIFSVATLRSRRVLFICLSYLDEDNSTEKAWSIIVSCENRCPTGLTQYRLEQEGDKVVVKRRHVTRQREMLVLISLENFVTMRNLKKGDTLTMSYMEAFKIEGAIGPEDRKEFGIWIKEKRELYTPAYDLDRGSSMDVALASSGHCETRDADQQADVYIPNDGRPGPSYRDEIL